MATLRFTIRTWHRVLSGKASGTCAPGLASSSGRPASVFCRSLRTSTALHAARRGFGTEAASHGGSSSSSNTGADSDEKVSQDPLKERWKLTQNNTRVEANYTDEDLSRFASERSVFRTDSRLQWEPCAPHSAGSEELDWLSAGKGLFSALRMSDSYIIPFIDLILDRLFEQNSLMERFDIPILGEMDSVKPMHNHAVPGAGVYWKVRMQVYWMGLHVWLLHNKQNKLQETEGVFGSALCALITRRLFEWQWQQVRGFLREANVPSFSITYELNDLCEFIFGLCVVLDDVFKEEALDMGTRQAISLKDNEIEGSCHGFIAQSFHLESVG